MKKLQKEIYSIRVDFNQSTFDEKQVKKDPYKQFNIWMQNALDAKVNEPTAMTLSTSDKKGKVDSRIVLLRDLDKNGFNFFTNYKSAKAREMKENKQVALNFFWPEIQRQVRIRGVIEKLPEKNSDTYFQVGRNWKIVFWNYLLNSMGKKFHVQNIGADTVLSLWKLNSGKGVRADYMIVCFLQRQDQANGNLKDSIREARFLPESLNCEISPFIAI